MSDYNHDQRRLLEKKVTVLEAQLELMREELSQSTAKNTASRMRLQHCDWVLKEGAYLSDADVCRCCKDTNE